MSDHSWVHLQIVLNMALRLYRMLHKHGVQSDDRARPRDEHQRRRGDHRRRLPDARPRDVDPPHRPRGVLAVPRRRHADRPARGDLRGARAHDRRLGDPARDHRPPQRRPAAHARGRRSSASPTRSTWSTAARARRWRPTSPNIHSLSAAAIDEVRIVDGETRPIRIEIEMNNSAGVFQVDSLLASKLRGSGLEEHIEVVAQHRGRAREAAPARVSHLAGMPRLR